MLSTPSTLSTTSPATCGSLHFSGSEPLANGNSGNRGGIWLSDFLAAAAKLRTTLAAKPFDPPSLKQLVADSASQKALRFLIDTGEAVEINAEVVMATESLKRMTDLIRQFIRDNGRATVSQIRQEVGCSRRIIVPMLERLDRDGVTMRNGDTRTLRAEKASSET